MYENKILSLGLWYDTVKDTLSCDFWNFKVDNESITEIIISSLSHKIFDILGITSPVTSMSKLILWKR